MSNPLIPDTLTHGEYQKFPQNYKYIDPDGNLTICNPTIQKLERGMNCLVWKDSSSDESFESSILSVSSNAIMVLNVHIRENLQQEVTITQIAEVWHSPKVQVLNRKTHQTKYGVNGIRRNLHGKGPISYIHNPTIDMLKPGMLCRAWEGRHPLTKKTFGEVIKEINHDLGKVLIGRSIGGTKEQWIWVDVVDLEQVWYIGTFSEVMKLINDFSKEVQDVIKAQERIFRHERTMAKIIQN